MITGEDLIAALPHATDLEGVKRALIREDSIRHVMAETGESRETVIEMIDAVDSTDREIITELTDGEPITLAAALRRYVDSLKDTDPDVVDAALMARGIADDLTTLLVHPWPHSEQILGTHDLNPDVTFELKHPDDEHVEVWIGGRFLFGASREDHGYRGMTAITTAARTTHREVLSRIIGDRPHFVRLNPSDVSALREWLGGPSGTFQPEHSRRLRVEADSVGNLIFISQPYLVTRTRLPKS